MTSLYYIIIIILCLVFVTGTGILIYDPSRINTLTVTLLACNAVVIIRMGYYASKPDEQ